MEATKKQNPFRRILQIRGAGQVLTVTVGLIILCAVFSFLNDNFFSYGNATNLLRQICPILLVGIGQSFVLITGNIDLSIGSVLGMSGMISATLMTNGVNPWIAVAITLAAALGMGVANGLLVSKCKLPPFIATLGTMTIARGIAQIVNGNYNTDSIGSESAAQSFKDVFYYGEVFKGSGFYIIVLITIVLWLLFNFYLTKTRGGRHIYAIGSNVEAAKLSGVNVVATTTKAYVVSAFCACIAGFSTMASIGQGTMDAGNTYELYAVAASVIGGVSTLGGQGLLLGTVIGAAIWQVLKNGLQLAGAKVALQNIIIGIIVVIAVLLDVVVRGRKGKIKTPAAAAETPPAAPPSSPMPGSQDLS